MFTDFKEVPEWKKKVIKETMFTNPYTNFNNDEDREPGSEHFDPLGLKHCMRFYPHDDNQGGFFVCVMEKILDDEDGIIYDDDYSHDAWNNPNVRQKDISDDLNDFVKDFEKIIREQEKETGEIDDGTELEMMKALVKEKVEKTEEEEETKGSIHQ